MKFKALISKTEHVYGIIEIDANNLHEATDRLMEMVHGRYKSLEHTDPRIVWDEPEYSEGSLCFNRIILDE